MGGGCTRVGGGSSFFYDVIWHLRQYSLFTTLLRWGLLSPWRGRCVRYGGKEKYWSFHGGVGWSTSKYRSLVIFPDVGVLMLDRWWKHLRYLFICSIKVSFLLHLKKRLTYTKALAGESWCGSMQENIGEIYEWSDTQHWWECCHLIQCVRRKIVWQNEMTWGIYTVEGGSQWK